MRQLIIAGLVALGTVGVFAASIGGAQATSKASRIDPGRALVVTLVTPTRHQRLLPDLSDPGLNNVITVRFSTYVNPNDLIDEQNLVNNLSYKVSLHNSTLRRVSGVPSVRRNVFTFSPLTVFQPVLPQGRYTLTLKSSIRSLRGRLLNEGRADYTTTFSVGTDIYPPVLLAVSPAAGEPGIGRHRAIVATFDEPIDRASAAASVRLEDRSTDPPTRVGSRVRLARHGLHVVVAPRAPDGYPAGAQITLVIAGQGTSTDGSAAILKDTRGHGFTRDAGVQWEADPAVPTLFHSPVGDFDDATGEFTRTFRTKGAASAR